MSKIPKIFKNLEPQPIKPLTSIIKSNRNFQEENCCKNLIEWELFVELGAVHKLLNALKPDCLGFSESTEPCFREIIFKLEKLLEDWTGDDKKIKNLLANDNSFVKCQQCGVISIKKKKNNRPFCKSLEKNTQRLKTRRFSKGPSEDTSYSKVYEERKKSIQTNEKKNNFASSRSTDNTGNCKKDEDERYQQFLNSDSTLDNEKFDYKKFQNYAEERFINQKLDKQKFFTNKFDKYSERPLIEVSAPIRKASNIPRSNARFAQHARSRKINRREIELKETKIEETKIENKSKEVKLEEDLDPKNFSNNGIQDLSNLEDENYLDLKFQDESNNFSERKNPCQNEIHNGEDQYEQYKHLAKGDCSSFQINEDYSLSFDHWVFDEKKYSEKTDLEIIMKPENNLNNLKTVTSAVNILQSELEENQTLYSSSEKNSIHEWMTSLKKSKNRLKEKKCATKTQSTGIQTLDCPPLDIIQKIRAQITEAIDRFEDNNMIESEPKKFVEHQEKKSLDQKTTERIFNNKWQDNDQQIEVQMSYKNLSTVSSGSWAITDLGADHSEIFQRQIDYQKRMSPAIISTISLHETTSKIIPMYTKLLEGNKEMDWETFEELVESLHPTQRQLWRDICEAVRNEANRVAEKSAVSAEVCIEIKSVKKKKRRSEKKVIERDEIVFEMDMTLKDMENFLEKQLKSCLLGKKRKKMEMVEESMKKS